jgi:transcriptional regulator with XRE-family HTH domain
MDELGDFLKTRRARLNPEQAGVRVYGERRRVPGLRREELAQLAGVSVAYYTRLEQGQSRNASDGVLDALSRALQLDGDEVTHLRALARPASVAVRRRPRPERVRPNHRALLHALGDAPAVLIGRRTDVLAWTPMGHALLAGHLDFTAPDHPNTRPNMIRMVFRDAHMRELYEDWPTKSKDAVGYLRLVAGRYPGDAQLTELIGELSVASQEFARLWARHLVANCSSVTRGFRHPLVGALSLSEEPLDLASDPGLRLVIYSAEPGSPSEEALRLLTLTDLPGAREVPAGLGQQPLPRPVREGQAVRDNVTTVAVLRQVRPGRPREVVVQHLPERLGGEAGVAERLVEADDRPVVHLLVRAVAAVHPHH